MKKRVLLSALLLCSVVMMYAQSVIVNGVSGWLETASVQWQPVEGAESYNVYVTGEGIINHKIDDQLIRSYGSYLRADVPGLKAGSYTLAVAAVVAGEEGAATATNAVTVNAFDRSGFAFVNGRMPGAYKADGTLKDNAVVLYITQNSKNTITADVRTASNKVETFVGMQKIIDGFKKGAETRPFVFRFVGQVTDLAYMYNGDIVIENKKNHNNPITFEGIGDDAVIDGWGIRVKGAASVEIRNLGTMNVDSNEGDNIGLQQDNEYIWVHHCDFFYGHAGSAGDQAKGDGALDCKRSTYVTFSYNHYWDSGKCNLLGLSENTTDGLYITYHHNWFDHSDSRHPRVRFYSAHVYNNYYDGNSKYGVGSTNGSSVFVEKNFFRNCKNPMMISMQGTDTKMGADEKNSPTFSKENGGIIKSFDNIMVEGFTYVPYSTSNGIHFDAYDVNDRNQTVPSTVSAKQGGAMYNNFDTNTAVMYSYTPDEPSAVVGVVTALAGRQDGGDFKWSFNNAIDDASSDVNPALKSALVNYKTKMVTIQGDAESTENPDEENGEEDPDGDGGIITGNVSHNFTTQEKTSKFFTIAGDNLATNRGSITLNGETLTKALKINTAGSVEFTLEEPAKLTLYYNQSVGKRNNINDVVFTIDATETVIMNLEPGHYKLYRGSNGNETNLFFISLEIEEDPSTSVDKSEVALKLYPNPVRDILMIDCEAEVMGVELYNVAGALVMSQHGSVNSIQLGHLNKGVYLVRVRTEQGYIQRSVMKM